MKIHEELNGRRLVLFLKGNFDETSSPVVEEKLQEALSRDIDSITFNLKGVEYISSAGIRVLIMAYKKMVKSGKSVHMAEMSGKVRDMLEVVGILPLFAETGRVDTGA